MVKAGHYSQRVRLERRPSIAGGDGYGNWKGGWSDAETIGERAAAFKPDALKEQMEAGRLVAPLIGVLTLRSDAVSQAVTTADRAVLLYAPYAGKRMEILSILAAPDGSSIDFAVQEDKA